MSVWQHIDTAPKDGSTIDLYGFLIPGYGGKSRSFHREPGARWSASDGWWVTQPPARFIAINPTHWMPVPDAPK